MRRNDREVTGRQGIEEILRDCKTCHIAMTDAGRPYVVPLNYGYAFLDDNTLELTFHSAKEGRKLDILRKDNRVCFSIMNEGELIHAETPCGSGYYYASVIGNGEVRFLSDPTEKGRALSLLVKHQTGRKVTFTPDQIDSVCVFEIISSDYTGKRKSRGNV